MDDIFSYGWSGFKKFFKENLVAILYTLILHLVVLIILIFVKVDGLKKDRELGIELEFEERTLEEILAEEVEDIPAEWAAEISKKGYPGDDVVLKWQEITAANGYKWARHWGKK